MTEASNRDLDVVIDEFVKSANSKFQPYAYYSKVGDAVFVHLDNVPVVRRRLDRYLTIFVSEGKREFCGFVLRGFTSLLGKTWTPHGKLTVKIVFEQLVKSRPEVLWEESIDTRRLKEFREQTVCLT
ncbi:MAG: hypothetical protein IT458_19760 [Planctomycetes bacterium]|nr:hypothetical protein [Planctomycetota bacterium]